MATASGEELLSLGVFTLDALSAEGNLISQQFEDADVDMPIMAVVELAANGSKGSDVLFWQHDGALIDNATGKSSKIIKRKGVYFMKIFIPKSRVAHPDFARPGTA